MSNWTELDWLLLTSYVTTGLLWVYVAIRWMRRRCRRHSK